MPNRTFGSELMTKSTHWHVLLPGECYSNDLRFKVPLNETEVRQYLRDYHEVERLWNGTQIWIA